MARARELGMTKEVRGAAFIKLSGCHKADISTPGEYRGRGPSAASYHEVMTPMTMGGAGVRRSRTELRRWQPESVKQRCSPLNSVTLSVEAAPVFEY